MGALGDPGACEDCESLIGVHEKHYIGVIAKNPQLPPQTSREFEGPKL